MLRVASRLRRLGWKWWLLIATLTILFIVGVAAPAAIYYSRDREPPDYSGMPTEAMMTYLVSYDSGDGVVNESKHTLKVEFEVEKGGETCFYVATSYDPHPKRKVNARIVGSTKVTVGKEEIWRSEDDLRLVYREVMEMDLPIVNTAVTTITYAGYDGYPGWPFHLNDSWTYEESYDTDAPLQPGWIDRLRAEVVADDAAVVIEGVEYQCFKVVHTLIDTTNGTPPGNGVGATCTEYWYKDRKSIAPIQIEGKINFRGTETQTMMGTTPPPFLH